MNILIEEQKKLINNNKTYNCNKKIGSFVYNIGILIMDIYSISRIFRNFNSKKKNTNKNIGNQENIIYYCGETHAETFKEFMTYLEIQIIVEYNRKTSSEWYLPLDLTQTSLLRVE